MLTSKCQRTQFLLLSLLSAACILCDASVWRKINGVLHRITFDGVTLIGLSADPDREGNVWIAEKDVGTNPNWHEMKGNCKNIISENWNVWCVQNNGEIYYARYTGGADWDEGGWSPVLGHMRQVAVFPELDLIYGTNNQDELLFADVDIASEPNWQVIDKDVGEVKVGFGRSEEKYIAFRDTSGAIKLGIHIGAKPSWRNVRRDMLSISFDGKIMCGIDVFGQVQYSRDAEFKAWRVIEGPPLFRAVECSDDKLWALESGNGFVWFIDLAAIDNSTDPANCVQKDQQCSHPRRPCCNSCLFANPTRNTQCRKHEGQGGAFSFCLPWKCAHQGDVAPRSRSATTNVTSGYITAEDLSWMTPEELAEERKGAVIARAEFAKYYAAHQMSRKGTAKPKPK